MAIFPLSKLVSTTFPTVLEFFSHLFVCNYSVPKKYIIGYKTNKKSNRGVKIGYVMQNMFVFCQNIISPQKYIFRFFSAKNHIFCHYRPQNVHLRKYCYSMEKKHILHHKSHFGISVGIFVCFMTNNVIFKYRAITNK